MTGLAAVLAGHRPTGVFRWRAAYDVADVRRAVEQAGWRFSVLDGHSRRSKREVLGGLGEALGFPETHGANLDALHDALRGLREPTVLVWDGWETLARSDERTFATVLRILDGREHLAVLLPGEGPEVDVPDLD